MTSWLPRRNPPPPRDPDHDRGDDTEGSFGNVFGAEIPDAERAWRRGEETDPADRGGAGIPDSVLWALQGLPETLREIRAEVRRATDLATDALAARSSAGAEPEDEPDAESRPFDPVPAALRELREEVREVVDRASEMLRDSRRSTDALPSLVAAVREEFDRLSTRLSDALSSSNAEAARAFSLVAREVRTLGDRQAVLREEVRLLGKKLEEAERLRRQSVRRQPGRRAPAPAVQPPAPPVSPLSSPE